MRASVSLYFVLTAVAALLVGGGARLAHIEHSAGELLKNAAHRQQTAVRTIPARRGEILDARGRVLAGTVRRGSVFVDPGLVRDARFAAYSLGPVLGRHPATFERELTAWRDEDKRFVWLARRISDEQLAELERVIDGRRLRAFGVQQEPARVYPHGRVAPHVIGFVGTDAQGLAGVEAQFDSLMRGAAGQWAATVDVSRRQLRAEEDAFRPARDGASVVLTIDAVIQQIAQEELAAAVGKHAAEWGVAVVIDPQSGELLAMAIQPDFDPADPVPDGFGEMSAARQEAVKTLWRNRAVSDAYEPGSVFKPFIAVCALDDRIVRIDEVFAINGPEHSFGRRRIRDTHGYDRLPVHEIISKSSNIGMGMIGARCGMQRLHDYVRRFGFGQPTGVQLPGESSGLVLAFDQWNPSYSPQSIPIGQEVAVTPIQLVSAFSAFSNGGWLLAPRVVRGVVRADGHTLQDHSRPIQVRRVLSEATAEMFRQRALVETVREGTGKPAALKDYQVFGKTGTAQIARQGGGGYLPGCYVGSFIGGAPADSPRIVVLVSIYKPTKDGYYGGVVAAPAVKEIIARTLAYLRVPPVPVPADGAVRATRAGGD